MSPSTNASLALSHGPRGVLKVKSRGAFSLGSPGVGQPDESPCKYNTFPQGLVVGGGTCRTHSALTGHLELVIYPRAKTSEAGTRPLPEPWRPPPPQVFAGGWQERRVGAADPPLPALPGSLSSRPLVLHPTPSSALPPPRPHLTPLGSLFCLAAPSLHPLSLLLSVPFSAQLSGCLPLSLFFPVDPSSPSMASGRQS